MVRFDYLHKGLCAMARAHRANTMVGHLGAAVTAGYFFGEERTDLDPRIYAAVEGELDRIMGGGETIWYDQEKAGLPIADLFEPFPDQPPVENPGAAIAKALMNNIAKTRQSGHNVIFASLAIRALRDHPEQAGAKIVSGIGKLIAGFDKVGPGRGYYGREKGWKQGNEVVLADDDGVPPYRSTLDMAARVVAELIASAPLRRRGFGGLFHLINHAAALLELERLGYPELVRTGLPAHRRHLRLWKSLPDLSGELGPLVKAERSPTDPAYWPHPESAQWSGWLTHRVKTLFGFSVLLETVGDAGQRREAEKQFLYLMA